jgi:hypothetical protein
MVISVIITEDQDLHPLYCRIIIITMQVITLQSCSDIKTMSHLNIVYLSYFADAYRLAGYSLFVSNSSTSKTDGYLCYHHTGTTLPAVFQNVKCNHLGQYVIFYNERDKLGNNPAGYSNEVLIELCNVEVNGMYTCLQTRVTFGKIR